MVVEVTAIVTATGVTGLKMEVPRGIKCLLANQISINDLRAEAVLPQSRELALQALLVDPVFMTSRAIAEMLDHMIKEQSARPD